MRHRTFALIVFVLLVIVVVANRTAVGDKPLLQDTLTLLLTDDAAFAEALERGDGAEEALRRRFAPYLTNAALRDFLASESVHRLPLCLHRAGAEIDCGKVTLTQAENATGYTFSLPLRCTRDGQEQDFALTGYVAFESDRLCALRLDDTQALERWLGGAE